MTTQPDVDRALGAWLRDVPPHTDRARMAALAQLAVTRQHRPRPSWLHDTRAAGPRRTPGRSSVSAMRPLVLVALIALGTGSVYLAGQGPSPVPTPLVATTSPTVAPSPTASPTPARSTKPASGLLASLVTEEVEPGVLRVVSDGHRDVSLDLYDSPATWDSSRRSNVVAGPDGSVWLFGADAWYRLGEPATYPVTDETPNQPWQMAQVAPDGTLWTLVESDGGTTAAIASFRDGAWTVRNGTVGSFDLEPDGTVWVSTASGFVRLRDASQILEAADGQEDTERFWVSPVEPPAEVGDVEFVVQSGPGAPDSELRRSWLREDGEPHSDVVDGVLPVQIDDVDMDPHGALWIYQTLRVPVAGTWEGIDDPDTRTIHYLVHVAEESVVYTDEQGVPELGGSFRAAPDGSAWLAPRCGGIANFDGTTWTRYLPGRCVVAFDISPDGTVWLQAAPEDNTFSEEPDEADTTETLVIPG